MLLKYYFSFFFILSMHSLIFSERQNTFHVGFFIFVEGVEFTKRPTNITISEGESGQTSCEGKGKPMPKITWAKAETNSALPKNFKVVKNKTLVVNSAEKSNGGTYFCMIANGQTSRNVEFEVIVTRRYRMPFYGIIISYLWHQDVRSSVTFKGLSGSVPVFKKIYT